MAKKYIKLHGDRLIWVVVMLLALISLVAVYSATSAMSLNTGVDSSRYLFKQLAFVIMGFGALLTCYIIPLRIYRMGSILLFLFSAGLLVYVIVQGMVVNHAARWIMVFGQTFQPSELAKIATVLYLARTLETKKLETFKEYTIWILIPIGAMLLLCLYGSASVTIILGTTVFLILISSGIRMKFIWYTVGIIIVGIMMVFLIHKVTGIFTRIDTVTARIERFVSKDKELKNMTAAELEEYKAKTFQSNEAKQAIQLGGLFGRGPGNSLKRETLPEPSSDFIFAIIVEEFGLFISTLVIMLYIWFFSRCIAIAKLCTKTYPAVVVLGLGFIITLQALVHILVNVGIFPVTGQTLPMVSRGGTAHLMMSCAFGIILSVNKTIEIKIENNKNG